jgi:UDP-N-acetyl-D-glucosamine dehydrogenase
MELKVKIENNTALIGIIGLGYVGLPLALEFSNKGFPVIGFDIDDKKIAVLNSGKSYIKHIKSERIKNAIEKEKFSTTSDFSRLSEADAILVCVPTPLNAHREPDMKFIESSANMISKHFRKGQLIVLESSTYPGTTDEILLPLLENPLSQNGNKVNWVAGKDFYLAYSPEREDPNNRDFNTSTIPKVVGGVTPACLEITCTLYNQIVVKTVPVSSTRTAETTKLLENIYRCVNIALVNELKIILDKMGIDVWEVIEAAKTKPFGFQAFYPGPGLGGHCIPIDPFYFTWKSKEFDMSTKFIELAGEINTHMPYYIIEISIKALNVNKKSMNGAKILILGASYKKDIDDTRESPSLKLIELCLERGAIVDYNDPYIPILPKTRQYKFNLSSVDLTKENLSKYDLIILSTNHTVYDYKFIYDNSNLILDTRNAFNNFNSSDKLFKA